ncbi:hypothetical protein KKG90_05240 [Candidatus Bipolaricaulota bacterium]|nr:hypothetical protein [Candidatus Bipolaricaulota bacterium]
MRRIAVVTTMLIAIIGLAFASFGTETIITTGGSVLAGVIESGLPATVSITSETGDVFTVQRANMKHIRFEEKGAVTVETVDGNIIVGELGGVSTVFGLKTASGDIQSISVDSIVEIRFDPTVVEEVPVAVVQPLKTAVSSSSEEAMIQAVVDEYENRVGSFTLGLDSGPQLAFSMKNGFGTPRFSVGINGILLGLVGRIYFPPSVSNVERTAKRLYNEGVRDAVTLLEETRAKETPFLVPYVQLGTDAFIIPHAGGGVLLRLGKIIYFDLGATLDTIGVPWVSFGLLFFF